MPQALNRMRTKMLVIVQSDSIELKITKSVKQHDKCYIYNIVPVLFLIEYLANDGNSSHCLLRQMEPSTSSCSKSQNDVIHV